MRSIKPLVVLPVAALHFTVMPWCIGTNYLVLNPMLSQTHLEKGGLIPVGSEPIGKFGAIVRLDALNRAGEGFYKVFHKEGRRIGTVFLKCLHKTPPGILINGSILEEMFANYPAVYKAGRGNKFHIHLYTLPRMIHLLIRFWDIFGVRWVDCHNALFFEEAVESSKGSGITTLPEFNPENNKTCMGVTPAHIGNKLNLVRGMLFGVVVGSAGKVAQGLYGTVKASFPSVDVLPVRFIFDGGFRNPIFLSVTNK